jgi:hypothetical protein
LPTVLDLLDAVTRVSTTHPDIREWWLTPRSRLPLRGAPSRDAPAVRAIELAVWSLPWTTPDYPGIERELRDRLPGSVVTVRAHLREREPAGLIRLFTSGRDEERRAPTQEGG